MNVSVPSSPGDQSPVRCFLSYSHADDELLNFASAFKQHLEAFCFAERGRRVEIFLDRESIGWGADWREQISDGIRGALAFIPVITRTYFERPSCREELLTFYNSAATLGVTDLFLPVVVLGHSYITDTADDPVARIVSQRQYVDLKEVALEGVHTPRWRRSMLDLANKLIDAVEIAETSLAAADPAILVAPEGAGSPGEADDLDDPPGLQEIMVEFEQSVSKMNENGTEMAGAMEDFAAVMVAGTETIQTGTVSERRAKVLGVAEKMKPVSQRLGHIGQEWEGATAKADASIRLYHSIVRDQGLPDLIDRFRYDIEKLTAGLETLDETERSIVGFLDSLRPIEVMSSPMRAAIRPARTGVKSVQSAMDMVRSWRDLTI